MTELNWDRVRLFADIASRRPEHERERVLAQAVLELLPERERLSQWAAADADEAAEIKALLIEMRRYFISHNLPTGECTAWNGLKRRFGVGESDAADEAWMTEHIGQP